MSAGKLALLALYAVLAGLAVLQAGTPAGTWAVRILVILAVAHLVEMVIFFKACQRAGGSLAGHMVNVFLFGVVHMKDIKATGTPD